MGGRGDDGGQCVQRKDSGLHNWTDSHGRRRRAMKGTRFAEQMMS